jgi:toxin HigB-1
MRVRFADKKLESLYLEGKGAEAYPQQVVRAFVKAVDFFQTFDDERQFYQFKGWHGEKLSGERKGQYSLRMNKQFRLV